MLTLAAHTPQRPSKTTSSPTEARLLAILVLCIGVYFCYAHAHRIAHSISPSTVHGMLRIMAFILLCIGVQIAWNGLVPLPCQASSTPNRKR